MENRKTVFKWLWVWEYEKEEQWLNEMALEGWALERTALCFYTFSRCEPGEYIIRLEMHSGDDGYLEFMRSTGAELVGSWFQWKYFRRRSDYGSFDVFSDIDTRIGNLERISNILRIVGAANIVIGIVNSWHPAHIGYINLLCGCLLMYGLGRVRGKEEELRKERMLHE